MSENENSFEQNSFEVKENSNGIKKSPILKCLACCALIFLGAFCAFYVLVDWHLKQLFAPNMILTNDKIISEIERDVNNINRNMKTSENRAAQQVNNIIHFEESDNEYKIKIDLRKFNDNDRNIQVKTMGNILNINARAIRSTAHREQISEFQQSYLFSPDVKLSELTKERDGNYYVITIPIEKN